MNGSNGKESQAFGAGKFAGLPPVPPGPDNLGLPANMNNITPEQMIEHFQGKIHQAIDFLPSDQIQEILRRNPQAVNEKGFNGMVPLHRAAMRGDPKLLDYMLKCGANPNERNNFEETPLHFAAKSGSPVILHRLTEAGADLSLVDKGGRGVMHMAAQSGSVPALLYLQQVHGLSADVTDYNDITPLHLVCAHGHVDALNYILKKDRVNLYARDIHGNTCLHIASQYCMLEVMWLLMERGGYAFLHERNREGFIALDLCQHSSGGRRLEGVKLLSIYMKNAKSGRLTGPIPVWWGLLFFPFASWWFLLIVAQMFDEAYKGMIVLVGVIAFCYFLFKQSHRMNHVCRWPNPIYCGTFAAGIFSTEIVYFCQMYPLLIRAQRTGFCLFTVLAVTLHIMMYYLVLRRDPGLVRETVRSTVTGIEVTIRHIASGDISLDALCPHCELIPPPRTHHCRLCTHCYAVCDHHCLFLYRCVAVNTHRLFLAFIAYTAVGMLCFTVAVYIYIVNVYTSPGSFWTSLQFAFNDIPGLVFLGLANAVSCFWLVNLLRYQLRVIGRNHTTAYQPNRGRTSLTGYQQFRNIVNFVLGKRPYSVEVEPSPVCRA